MFWMTTLLGMLLMGAIEIASSDPDPEDEGTEPDERQTADLSGQNQFHPAKIDPSTVKPEEFSPDTSEAPLGTPTAPVRGSAADDSLIGHDGPDRINGYGGNDTISGRGGDDDLWGGNGQDLLRGGAGDDTLHGNDGDDNLSGQAGNDSIFGYHDDDTLRGGTGMDTLIGGMGNDLLNGGEDDDQLSGGIGDDTLIGGQGEDVLFGDLGNDRIDGTEQPATDTTGPQQTDNKLLDERDYLNGGDGDDTLIAGASDVVTPGLGQDTIILDAANAGKTATSIIAFDSQHDSILITHDDKLQTPHDVRLRPHHSDPRMTEIVLDGAILATMNTVTGFKASDIVLVTGTQT